MERVLSFAAVACLVAWGMTATGLSSYMRNIISIAVMSSALILFFIVREWKLNGIIFTVILAMRILAEKYPKNAARHKCRREKVTFLQDFFSYAGILMLFFEIYELVIISQLG